MGKHLSKFFVYYLFLNVAVFTLSFSVVIMKGIMESNSSVFRCVDIASNVSECNFGEFLIGIIFMFWVIFFFAQIFLFFSSLISYLIFVFLSNKIKEINEKNLYIKFLIFFFINILIFIPVFIIYLNFSNFPPDQL